MSVQMGDKMSRMKNFVLMFAVVAVFVLVATFATGCGRNGNGGNGYDNGCCDDNGDKIPEHALVGTWVLYKIDIAGVNFTYADFNFDAGNRAISMTPAGIAKLGPVYAMWGFELFLMEFVTQIPHLDNITTTTIGTIENAINNMTFGGMQITAGMADVMIRYMNLLLANGIHDMDDAWGSTDTLFLDQMDALFDEIENIVQNATQFVSVAQNAVVDVLNNVFHNGGRIVITQKSIDDEIIDPYDKIVFLCPVGDEWRDETFVWDYKNNRLIGQGHWTFVLQRRS